MTPGTPRPDDDGTPPEPLSPAQVIVLGLLRFAGRATPYDLKQGVARSVGNFWSVPHSQLYAEPDRLVARGLADVEQEPDGRRRKSYAVTPAGEAALDAWVADPPADLGELRTPALLAVFFGADPAVVARTQLPQHRAKLEEYERLLGSGAVAGDAVPRGPGRTLRAGVLTERAWITYWEEMLDDDG